MKIYKNGDSITIVKKFSYPASDLDFSLRGEVISVFSKSYENIVAKDSYDNIFKKDDTLYGSTPETVLQELLLLKENDTPTEKREKILELINSQSYILFGNTNTTKNLNAVESTPFGNECPIFGSVIDSSGEGDFSANTSQDELTVNFNGRIEGWVNVYMVSFSSRCSVGIAVRKNNIKVSSIGASGYIRNASGHNTTSVKVPFSFSVSSGDVIKVGSRREAANGTAFMSGTNNSQFYIKRTINNV